MGKGKHVRKEPRLREVARGLGMAAAVAGAIVASSLASIAILFIALTAAPGSSGHEYSGGVYARNWLLSILGAIILPVLAAKWVIERFRR